MVLYNRSTYSPTCSGYIVCCGIVTCPVMLLLRFISELTAHRNLLEQMQLGFKVSVGLVAVNNKRMSIEPRMARSVSPGLARCIVSLHACIESGQSSNQGEMCTIKVRNCTSTIQLRQNDENVVPTRSPHRTTRAHHTRSVARLPNPTRLARAFIITPPPPARFVTCEAVTLLADPLARCCQPLCPIFY